MALKVSLKKQGNQLEKLSQQLLSLNNAFVEVGHFSSQGKHASGFTYPELMAIHHAGNPETDLPARPVLDILFFRRRKLTAPVLRRAFKLWKGRKPGNGSDGMLLDDIGKFFREEEQKIFGSPSLVPNAVPPKESNNPLVDTGDLKSKVAYRTSKNKQVKEA
jgi:hypothetical protein